MTAVVSDTSPLNYLLLIGAVDLLPRLFSEIFIPPIVAEELSRPNAPEAVRAWISSPPQWLQIRSPLVRQHHFDLDEGEAQAILLAQELKILSVLIDERKGFHTAESLGLEPIGLLGILELCAMRGWIDFDERIARLRLTNFRFHERLVLDARSRLARAAADGNG
jgi:predicted nucleic acid-binding protein